MLFLGLGPASKIAFGVLLGFFPVTLSVLAGIRQVPETLITVAVSMGAGRWTLFRKVMLPAMASTMVGGLRSGLALSVVGVLVGELLGARAGLGYVINYAYGLMMTADGPRVRTHGTCAADGFRLYRIVRGRQRGTVRISST